MRRSKMCLTVMIVCAVVAVLTICIGVAFSQETVTPACIPPNLSCPQCIVTCPEIPAFPACPACPDVVLNCSDNSTSFPGYWKVSFKGKQHCGKVTGYGDQIIMYDEWGKQFEWLLVDKKLIMQSVESCN